MRSFTAVLTILLFLALGRSALAEAGASDWSVNEQGSVRLIAALTATGGDQAVQLGLEFALKPDWKIYWRSPGDAGYPPSLDWGGSTNLAKAVLSWPAPRRFSVSGLETVGYEGDVVLPVLARLERPDEPLAVKASVDYLTCAVICVPQHVTLALTLPAGPAAPSAFSHRIGRALAAVPGDGAAAGLSLRSVRAGPDGRLTVAVTAVPPLIDPDLFIERGDQMQFSRPKVRLRQGGGEVLFETAPVAGTGEGGLTDKPLTLTLVDGDRAMEATARVEPTPAGPRLAGILAMLAAALLGGFILNLMPCVLPVLSLKIFGLITHAGSERRAIRRGFLATAAGIVASFLVLAVVTSLLKAAGGAVGWGIQFQQPVFLAGLAGLVTLFAANLFGFFEISLPQGAADLGRGSADPKALSGHFAAGAFATVLATPCSAPFLGTAVGFALAHGTLEILGIFLALGFGMASPYLLVAVWPEIGRRLPRPGQWMVHLRRLLGLMLAGTALWLLFILAAEAGLRAAIEVGTAALLSFLLLGLGRRLPRLARAGAVAVLLGSALLAAGGSAPRQANAASARIKDMWTPFDRQAIDRDVAAGKLVFVDVTADWCITCQVNKAAVVYRGAVAQRLAGPGIVAMQADWTRPDDAIAAYLAGFGRYGIPFDAVYGPGAPDGIALPEVLTETVVLDALSKAARPQS